MLLQCRLREELMLMGEYFLVPRAEIAHSLVMCRSDMVVQMGPAKASDIAASVWTIVPKKKEGIVVDIIVCIPDTQCFIHVCEVAIGKIFVSFGGIVGEDEVFGFGLLFISKAKSEAGRDTYPTVSASSCLV